MFLLVKLMQGTADTFTLVFYRSLVQVAISLSSIIRNGENPLGDGDAKTKAWLFVRGGFGAGAVIAWFFGVQHLPLPDAVTLQFTTPAFSAALAVCFAGEKWLKLDMIGAVVCILGVALIAHPTWLFGQQAATATVDADDDPLMKAIAVAVCTGGAAMAGIAYVSVRMIGNNASANVMVLYYGVLSIPIVLFGSRMCLGKWTVWGNGSFTWWDYFMLLMTGFGGYGGQLFTNLGLQRETAATVSAKGDSMLILISEPFLTACEFAISQIKATLATCTQIVWTYIFELTFLHESIDFWSVAGTALILGFMVIVGISKMKGTNRHKGERKGEEREETSPTISEDV